MGIPAVCGRALLILTLAFTANDVPCKGGVTQTTNGPLTLILVESDGQEWSRDIQRDSVWHQFVVPISSFGSGGDFLNTPVTVFRLVPVGGGTIGGPMFEVADWIDHIILGDTLIDDFEDESFTDWHINVALNGSYLDVEEDSSTPDASLRCLMLRHGNTLFGTFAGWMEKQLNGLALSADDSLRLWSRGCGYTVSNVGEPPPGMPVEFALHQNYPNPFNPKTIINYQQPASNWVILKLYDVLGQEVTTLVDEMQEAGYKSVEWDATGFASGVYFYRLHAGAFTGTNKMIIMK